MSPQQSVAQFSIADDSTTATGMTSAAHRLPPDEPLLDLYSLEAIAEFGAKEMRELLDTYLLQAEEFMSKLQRAIAIQSAENVQLMSHKLVGSSAAFGLKALIAPLRALEFKGREGQLSGAEKLFAQVDERLKLSKRAIADFICEIEQRIIV